MVHISLFRKWSVRFALLLLCLSATTAAAFQPTIALLPNDLYPGDVARLEIAPTPAVAAATLLWQERQIPLLPTADGRRLFALFGIPRHLPAGPHRADLEIALNDGRLLLRPVTLAVSGKEFPEQHLRLPPGQVSPDQASLARHRAERRQIDRVFAENRARRPLQSSFRLPVPGRLLSPFGVQRVLNGQPRSFHSGVDQRARLGEPVAAAGAGQVVLTGDHFFAGKSVYIDHGMGVVTMYFHLSGFRVAAGQQVAAGQVIGLAGASGRATGPHLHWGARVHNVKVDPLALVRLLATPP